VIGVRGDIGDHPVEFFQTTPEEGDSSMRLFSLTFATALLAAACSQPAETPADETAAETPPAVEETQAAPVDSAIDRAVADASRPEGDRSLDVNRHPAEVLAFVGVEAGWRVADIVPGGGYYSRVLSTAVGEAGQVYAFNPTWVAERFGDANTALGELADTRVNMERLIGPIEGFDTQIEEPLDAVFMVLFYHDTGYDGTDRAAMNQSIYESLRPGGVYLVIDHHAPEGSGLEAVNTTHRIDADFVRDEVTAAGFVLDTQSDMLANAEDPRDISVFDPAIRRQTDRFVYLFRKPE
jgi:predicted methyltransferase